MLFMAFKQFVPLLHPNFQFNRVLAHGKEACREEELWEIAPRLGQFNFMNWYKEWRGLATRAEDEARLMHAAYYHRMSEFFLPDGRPEKPNAYQDFRRCFYQAVSAEPFEHFEVPYEGVHLPAMRLRATQEKPVSSVLDFLKLQAVTLVGISLGGYLALRAAAFEPRIQNVVAYDMVYDAFTCFTEHMPEPFRSRSREMVKAGQREEINGIAETLRAKDDLLDWALTHGMYITGTSDPFVYFKGWTAFNTKKFSSLIRQDVLLLAGENDHLVPLEMYHRQKEALVNARSVRGRIFTASEGGDQHCQVGNLDLAWHEILEWLNEFNA
jgi:alpha/beta hydrolase fold